MPRRRMLRGKQCVTSARSFSNRRPSKNSMPTPEKRTWNGQRMMTKTLFSPTLRPTSSIFLERRSLLAQNYVSFSPRLGIFLQDHLRCARSVLITCKDKGCKHGKTFEWEPNDQVLTPAHILQTRHSVHVLKDVCVRLVRPSWLPKTRDSS